MEKGKIYAKRGEIKGKGMRGKRVTMYPMRGGGGAVYAPNDRLLYW